MGLLAGVFGDGTARVIDIRKQWLGGEAETVHVKIDEAGWTFEMGEDVLATCIAWKSHTEIIVGCSNGPPASSTRLTVGFVAIFDLSDTSDDRIPGRFICL